MNVDPDSYSRRHGWLSLYGPLVIWIAVIFFLSTPQGSMTQTSRFIRPLLEFLFPSASAEEILTLHGYVRKLAHLAVYGALGYFAYRAFSGSINTFMSKYWFSAGFGLVALIAVIDEMNQSFEPSRTASPWDVLIDISGGSFVLLICYIWKVRKSGSQAIG